MSDPGGGTTHLAGDHTPAQAQQSSPTFPGRVGLVQRVLPAYRATFFDALAEACKGGLSVFAGEPFPEEGVRPAADLRVAQHVQARTRSIFPVRSPLHVSWQVGLLDWLEEWQPDALIVDANPHLASTPSAIRWMRERARPVIGWGLGAPPYRRSVSLGSLLAPWRSSRRSRLLFSFDALIAYSKRGANEYAALGFPKNRIFVAKNAVAPRPDGQPRQRPDAFSGRPRVLYVGRLQDRKRLDNLMRAAAALPPEVQPEVWIVGDGPARVFLEKMAGEIYPRTVFWGSLYGDALSQRFHEADLFVLPGTGGLAVQQAMAHALPVIVAQGDGTQDNLLPLKDGESLAPGRQTRAPSGFQVPPDDLPALVQAMQDALSDTTRLRRMGAEAFRIVSDEVNLEEMVAAFVRALNETSGIEPGKRSVFWEEVED